MHRWADHLTKDGNNGEDEVKMVLKRRVGIVEEKGDKRGKKE